MKLTKEQKDIFKKAYNQKRFTKKLHNTIMNEDITVIKTKLAKIGYEIGIRPIKNEK